VSLPEVITDDVVPVGDDVRGPGGTIERVELDSGLEGLAAVGRTIQVDAGYYMTPEPAVGLGGHKVMVGSRLDKDIRLVAVLVRRVVVHADVPAPSRSAIR